MRVTAATNRQSSPTCSPGQAVRASADESG
jgi:hypothetical protein